MPYEARELELRHLPLAGQEHEKFDWQNPQGMDGRELALMPTAVYVGREGFCRAKDDTCEGRRAKGTEFCIGHIRQQEKNERAQAGRVDD